MSDFVDPYLDPKTGILRNLVGATTSEQLREAEVNVASMAELNKEQGLSGLSREDFAKRLAYFYEQLNFIHPFRKGNGRTQQSVAWKSRARISTKWKKSCRAACVNAIIRRNHSPQLYV